MNHFDKIYLNIHLIFASKEILVEGELKGVIEIEQLKRLTV